MLMLSLAVFTLVAAMGLSMGIDAFQGRGSSRLYALIHAGMALFGLALVINVALRGDDRLYINIFLAVAIIIVGVYISFQRAKGIQPRGWILVHGGTAVANYLLLAYYLFTG